MRTIRVCSKRGGRKIISILPTFMGFRLDILLRLSIPRKDRVHVLLISAAGKHLVPVVAHMSIWHGDALVISTLARHSVVTRRVRTLVVHHLLTSRVVHGPLVIAVGVNLALSS